jgi:hypothetical protein
MIRLLFDDTVAAEKIYSVDEDQLSACSWLRDRRLIPGRAMDASVLRTSAYVWNAWSYTFTSPYVSTAWCLEIGKNTACFLPVACVAYT